jgi:hypothetical protein
MQQVMMRRFVTLFVMLITIIIGGLLLVWTHTPLVVTAALR